MRLLLTVSLLTLLGCPQPATHNSTVVGNPTRVRAAPADGATLGRLDLVIQETLVHPCSGDAVGFLVDGSANPLVGSFDAVAGIDAAGIAWPASAEPWTTCAIEIVLAEPVEVALQAADGATAVGLLDVDRIVLSDSQGLASGGSVVLEVGYPGWIGAALAGLDGSGDAEIPAADAEILASHLATGSGLFRDDGDGVLTSQERAERAVLGGDTHPDSVGYLPGVALVGQNGATGRVDLAGSVYDLTRGPDTPDLNLREVATSPVGALAVGGDPFGRVVSSTDLETWRTLDVGDPTTIWDATWGGGRFVVAGGGDQILYGSDLSDLTETEAGFDVDLMGVAYGNGRFVAGGGWEEAGKTVTSADGITWSNLEELPAKIIDVAYGNGLFVAMDGDGEAWFSPDGTDWQIGELAAAGSVRRIVFENGRFVVLEGDLLHTSVDGDMWTTVNPDGLTVMDLAWTGTTHVAVTFDGGVYTASDDLVTWELLAEESGVTWQGVAVLPAP